MIFRACHAPLLLANQIFRLKSIFQEARLKPPHIKALLDKLLSDDSIVSQVDESITPIEPSSIEDRKDTDRKAKQILAFAFSSDKEMDDK